MKIGLSFPESDENKENEENFLLLSDIRPPFVESNPDKGSCTYYVITDRGGSLQMITVLHRAGPANDYGIT